MGTIDPVIYGTELSPNLQQYMRNRVESDWLF